MLMGNAIGERVDEGRECNAIHGTVQTPWVIAINRVKESPYGCA